MKKVFRCYKNYYKTLYGLSSQKNIDFDEDVNRNNVEEKERVLQKEEILNDTSKNRINFIEEVYPSDRPVLIDFIKKNKNKVETEIFLEYESDWNELSSYTFEIVSIDEKLVDLINEMTKIKSVLEENNNTRKKDK